MLEKKETIKKPITKDNIFKVMLSATFGVAGVFFIKNLVQKNFIGATVVGGSLLVFGIIVVLMKQFQVKIEHQQLMVSLSLLFLVCIISLNSGESYSDDFLLYLAVVGLTGLYLRPWYTKLQLVIADILLIFQYVIHPEKAESLGQYILCFGVFSIAGTMFYLAIDRGRAFIRISQTRAEEAEHLLDSLGKIGRELEEDFKNSSQRVESLHEANVQLENNAKELNDGSEGISQGAREVENTCVDVQDKISKTGKQIDTLNTEVKGFETILSANRSNMEQMEKQMETVEAATKAVNEVFHLLNQQMQKISTVTDQLNEIASSTTMLALNASIEAARAGQQGAGFAVVASKVQELAVDSNRCSVQVADVVGEIQDQISKTTKQLAESTDAIHSSLGVLGGLKNGFDQLTEQFGTLYQNIEAQNGNVGQVDIIFDTLKGKISEMSGYSQENQSAVKLITQAMQVYQGIMQEVIKDTKHVHELSAMMLDISQGKQKG